MKTLKKHIGVDEVRVLFSAPTRKTHQTLTNLLRRTYIAAYSVYILSLVRSNKVSNRSGFSTFSAHFQHIFLYLIFCFVSACDINQQENHGYGFSYDSETDLGIRYRNDGDPSTALTKEYIDAKLLDVYNCIQSSGTDYAPANPEDLPFNINLMVISVTNIEQDVQGRFFWNPDLILLLDRDRPYFYEPMNHTIRHEFVHYILKQTTGNPFAYHKSLFFNLCVWSHESSYFI